MSAISVQIYNTVCRNTSGQVEMSPKVVAVCFQGLAIGILEELEVFCCWSHDISLVPSLHKASRRSDFPRQPFIIKLIPDSFSQLIPNSFHCGMTVYL